MTKRTRIFRVQMEHKRYGTNWSSRDVAADTAVKALEKAERDEHRTGGKRSIRAIAVNLLAETDN